MAAIERIDLQPEIEDWKKAKKGRDVRGASTNAFQKVETSVNQAIDGVEQAMSDAEEALHGADGAAVRAENAMTGAEEAAEAATVAQTAAETAAEKAESVVGIGIATLEKPGLVKPDGTTTSVDVAGALKVIMAAAGMSAVDTQGLVGDVGADAMLQVILDELADRAANKLLAKTAIVNDFLATDPETVLSAPMGKELKRLHDELNSNLTGLVRTLKVENVSVNGNFSLANHLAGARKILYVVEEYSGSQHMILPFKAANGIWYLKFFLWDENMTPVPIITSATFTIYYIY